MPPKNRLVITFLLICAVLLCAASDAFTVNNRPAHPASTRLRAVGDKSNDDAYNKNNLDDLRRALESAWNTDTMGPVPSDPEKAAQTAATSVRNALDRDTRVVAMVDILLPQYDASQSDRIYDPVMAVEFCIALAATLETKSSIVVRDDKTVEIARRILDRREEASAAAAVLEEEEEEEEENDDDDTDDDTDDEEEEEEEEEGVNLFDESTSTNDVDAFRAKLAAEWNMESSTVPEETISKSTTPQSETIPPKTTDNKPASASMSRQYRLCSMLGDAVGMPKGPDMQRAVVEAIKAHALPRDDEETLIILSAASPQELIGIRALVAQYQGTKNIILVNCCVKPLPRELAKAQTVYSILPLIAKPTQNKAKPWSSSSSSSNGAQGKDQSPPKIVVLRRFPRDWEIFVDTGNGFDLAATAPASTVPQKGPSMAWVVGAVQRFLQARAR